MKILVTGGCGFIGSHLVDKLLSLEHEVVVIDKEFRWINLNVKDYYIKDINDIQDTSKAYENIDCVFHLAAEVEIQKSLEDPFNTFMNNIMGTQSVLENMRRHNIKKIIFSSTSAIYGDIGSTPAEEVMIPNPLNPYSLSKKIGEDLCSYYSQNYGIEVVILRYFNVFGPRQRDNSSYSGVITLFNKRAKNLEPLLITGDGNQTRDFIFVEDVVDANVAAMSYKTYDKGYIFNIATGSSISIKELADKISNNISFIQERKGEIKYSVANITAATSLLKWQPQYRGDYKW